MRIALIADTFPPMRTSGAVQLRDLSREFVRQGHKVTVILPSSDLILPWFIEDFDGVQLIRLRAPKTKDIGYVRRTVNEFLMPFSMLKNFRKSPLSKVKWDGVVWYSPTIFLGPLAKVLKSDSACRSYLIIRDIFPQWALDIGLLSRGLPYLFFKAIERYQYSIADVIGVQTPGNLAYFDQCNLKENQRLEVLQNWLTDSPDLNSNIILAEGKLEGRTIFVYAGNMGVAQGVGILIDLAASLHHRSDIGFLFVGRGSDYKMICEDAKCRGLSNVLFFDELDSSEISGLYAQCHIGIIVLDPRHKTHNIPGKFLSYMQAGLPVLASINPGNDLEKIILSENVGQVSSDYSVDTLQRLAINMVNELSGDAENNQALSERCKALSSKLFSSEVAVKQIISSLSS